MSRPEPEQDVRIDEDAQVIARHPTALRDYVVLETCECGVVLVGTEVKSLRLGQASLKESFVTIDEEGPVLLGLTIPEYSNASYLSHVPDRPRRVLLHRREIRALRERLGREHLTVVPIVLYWKRGLVKLLLGIARGKKLRDKRAELREREEVRALRRVFRRGSRG